MRKTATVTITDEGRDKGKVFVLTEMPASQVERWALRALLALSKSGVELPENVDGAGIAGVAALGLKALSGMDAIDAEYLLDEMFKCVKVQPSQGVLRDLIEEDIEEIATRLKLRTEVFKLHTDFSIAGDQSNSTSTRSSAPPSSNIPTSPAPSARVSHPARHR